ncbi:MAG: hypothetical protein JW838_05270 [Spirochaetes bacterium]|nr:hypothetical protein [Spirochaetota bacterium]
MRIDTHLLNTASRAGASPAREGRAAAAATPRSPATQAAGPASDRTLGDALAIARMSQNVIQRAISIAMRLKNIAANAIATGDLDRRALAETVSEIRSTLGERGTGTPPVLSAPAPSRNDATLSGLGEELGMLRDAASGIESGGIPQPGNIDRALRKLVETSNSYIKREIDLFEGITGTAPAGPGESAIPAALASRTGAAVKSDPATALKAQGNLTTAAVGRLTA